MTEKTYVYALRHPVSQEIGYVGSAKNPHRQLQRAFHKAKNGKLGALYAFLQELLLQDLKPEILHLELTPKEEVQARVKHWTENLGWIRINFPNHKITGTRYYRQYPQLLTASLVATRFNASPGNEDRTRYHAHLRRDLKLYFPKPLNPVGGQPRTQPKPNSLNPELLHDISKRES